MSVIRSRHAISAWLGSLCLLILCMIAVGGITRLTGSGLSIVDWKPILGALPPLSEADWVAAFDRYKLFPQYKLVNHSMTLPEFKFIYFWEYIHRLIGRSIGLVLVLPWSGFALKRRMPSGLNRKLVGVLALGGAQGLMGWIMVKSGLVDRPQVSHFRLAAHLSLALLVLGYLFWLFLDQLELEAVDSAAVATARPAMKKAIVAFTFLVATQIVFGAFVAGLKAGFAYSTFPKMMGHWIVPEAFAMQPFWLNFVENPAMVQFIHRSLAWSILAGALALMLAQRAKPNASRLKAPINTLSGIVLVQFVLGVSTLLLYVPTGLAVAHQLCGSLVLLGSLWALHRSRHAGI